LAEVVLAEIIFAKIILAEVVFAKIVSRDLFLSSARRRATRINAGIIITLIGIITICPVGISVRYFCFSSWILQYLIYLFSIDSRRFYFCFNNISA
jgi:hypothetical protein